MHLPYVLPAQMPVLLRSEKMAMKAFGLGAASSALYNIGSKFAPSAMGLFLDRNHVQ